MIAPYPTSDPRTIRRPRRPGEPAPYEPEITPVIAPNIPAPRSRSVTAPSSIPIPSAVGPEATQQMDPANIPGPNDIPGSDMDGINAEQEHARMGIGKPEIPGTRHGFGGRIKDFLETLLYSGGNPIAAGVAAGMPGKLAQWKNNMIEQPRAQRQQQFESQQEALRQQAMLRAAQQRKIAGDEEESTQMRPYRQRLMVANTSRAEAEAKKAGRPEPVPQHNVQVYESAEGLQERDPATGFWNPAKTAGGPMRKPVTPKSDLPEQRFAYQQQHDADELARSQEKEAQGIAQDFEKSKKVVTALDTEKNELWKATSQKPNAKGMVSYKGHDYLPGELASMAQQKEAEWQAAQAEFNGHRQRASQHPNLELDQSGVGIRFKGGRSVPQANAPASGKGKTVTYQGKKYRVASILPSGEYELDPL